MNTLRGNEEELIAETYRILTASPFPRTRALSDADLRQMVGGFVALIEESVEERPGDIRSMYMESVLPGIIRSGTKPERLTFSTAAFAVFFSHLLTREVPAEHHRGLLTWLEGFFGRYVAEETRVAYEAAGVLPVSGGVR